MRLQIRASLAVLAAACVTVIVAGCGSTAASNPAVNVNVDAVRGVATVEPAANPRPLGTADTAFGLDVMRSWCARYPEQNLVFSPSTLASALGMAYLGAGGATARTMARVLHLPAVGPSALAAQLQARSRALAALDGPGVTLAASNQVWADPTLTTLRGYLNAVATSYNAGVDKAPFSADPGQAANEINQAISAATRGHISRLVAPDMLANIGWVLTSALYLNAKWATPFEANKTDPAPFTPAGTPAVNVPFMNGDGFPYATAAGWTAVTLPYQGRKLAMTALLPPSGSGSCALPTTGTLQTMTDELAPHGRLSFAQTALLAMPKVKLSVTGGEGDMNAELKQLGMGQAFSQSADFTRLSPQACCIGFVQQAATLQVGERGTVASAAAAVGITATAGQAVSHTVVFNRPYLMLVTDTSTGEPLFLAKVANPSA
jgi:serine protease inhibitor